MIKFAKVIGTNTDLLSAQAFVFTQNESLALLISGAGDDIFTRTRLTSLDLEAVFFDSDAPISDRLTSCLKFLTSSLENTENLQIILAAWKDNALYLLKNGNHNAYLLRDKLINLTPKETTNQVVSGFLKPADKLLLITSKQIDPDVPIDQTIENWQETELKEFLTIQVEEFEDSLRNKLSNRDNFQPFAIILLEEEEMKKEITPQILENQSAQGSKIPKLSFSFEKFKLNKKPLILISLILVLLTAILIAAYYFKQSKTHQTSPENPKIVEEKNKETLNITEVNNWPLFLSLDLIKKDFNAKSMSYSLGKVLLLDENSKTLVAIDLKKKTNQILAGPTKLGQVRLASLNGQQAFTFSDDLGIVKTDLDSGKSTSIIKTDPEWGKITDMYAFASNIYLLDSQKNQIWKYSPIQSGYTGKQPYLKNNQTLDFTGVKKLSIDYSVWVLKSGPEIFRFTAGNPDNFSVGGMDKPLGNIQTFFMPEDEDFGFFLDTDNSRLVTLKKTGQYVSQLLGTKFKTTQDLVVDTEEKKIYLLESGKIYSLDLK